MTYLVWARKRNDSTALWADLPHAPRNRRDAESLIDYYEGEWGQLYEYEIHANDGFDFPRGMRQPCFVPRR